MLSKLWPAAGDNPHDDQPSVVDATMTTVGRNGAGARSWTRRDVAHSCLCLIKHLHARGIGSKDVVALSMRNSIEFLIAFLSICHQGAIAAPLNPAYTAAECEFYMKDAGAVLLLEEWGGNTAAETVAAQLGLVTLAVQAPKQGHLRVERRFVGVSGAEKTQPATQMPADDSTVCSQEEYAQLTTSILSRANEEDVALLLHTSGTTSRPKAVPLTQKNLKESMNNIQETYQWAASDKGYLVMPLFHVHGLLAGLLAPLGANSVVVIPGPFSASRFWPDIQHYQITWYTAVPTIHQILLNRAPQDYPSTPYRGLRFIRSCSSALALNLIPQLEATFHAPVLEAYAMTEACHQITSNPLPEKGPHKTGTVGLPPKSVTVRIVAAGATEQLQEPGQQGEICVQGGNVMGGYLANREANAVAFIPQSSLFRTGDLGFLDTDGYLTITGRLKEIINRGGEKISPAELDVAFAKHPAVKEVITFAMPDPKFGEAVAIAVVPSLGNRSTKELEDDLRRFGREHAGLAAFKLPARIFFADELPKTATGKVQRRLVAEHFLKS